MYYPQMYYFSNFSHVRNEKRLIQVLQNCAAMCNYTSSVIHRTMDVLQREKQLTLLSYCADICSITARVIARQGEEAQSLALLCVQICQDCGIHCLHEQPDELSHRCGQICLDCSIECRKYTGTES